MKKTEKGLAHFLEHMLFKGTKKYKTNLILNTKIDEISGNINASTTYNYTNYYINIINKYLIEALNLLKEMVFSSKLDSKEIEKEKQVVIEEINSNIDDSLEYCGDLLMANLYKENNIGHFVLGNKK